MGTGWAPAQLHKDQQFLPFKEALLHARSLKLKARKSGRRGARAVRGLPTFPPPRTKSTSTTGGKGTGTGWAPATLHTKEFLPFKKALLHARSLKLKSLKEWEAWCKSGVRTANMPSYPDNVYKHEGWQGYGHWLGTGNTRSPKQFLPFKEALLHARSLKLETRKSGGSGARAVNGLPTCPARPDHIYTHEGWQGYGHWLGTGNIAGGTGQEFLPFKKALLHARSLKLKGVNKMAGVVQERSTGGHHALQPTHNLQARGVARVRALAGQSTTCCRSRGAAVRTLPQLKG